MFMAALLCKCSRDELTNCAFLFIKIMLHPCMVDQNFLPKLWPSLEQECKCYPCSKSLQLTLFEINMLCLSTWSAFILNGVLIFLAFY